MPIEIECPSGLKGKVRGLKGRDGRYLTDQSLQRKGTLVDHILSNCWLETTDPGIYKASPGGAMNWGQVLQGDRNYALIQIRNAGEDDTLFDFPVQCKKCKDKFPWSVDLEDLPIKLLDEEVRAQLVAGENRFEIRVPGTEETRLLQAGEKDSKGIVLHRKKREIVPNTGTKLWFSLPTGADEVKMKKLTKQIPALAENRLVTSIAMRIREIEGVEFVESVGGLDPVWAMDAFAILCEKADIGRVMDSFRRAQKAIRSWSAGRAD